MKTADGYIGLSANVQNYMRKIFRVISVRFVLFNYLCKSCNYSADIQLAWKMVAEVFGN
jgi:hypothetical protein